LPPISRTLGRVGMGVSSVIPAIRKCDHAGESTPTTTRPSTFPTRLLTVGLLCLVVSADPNATKSWVPRRSFAPIRCDRSSADTDAKMLPEC
jgi:hypothetical protein